VDGAGLLEHPGPQAGFQQQRHALVFGAGIERGGDLGVGSGSGDERVEPLVQARIVCRRRHCRVVGPALDLLECGLAGRDPVPQAAPHLLVDQSK
jgi:hypothetical protein